MQQIGLHPEETWQAVAENLYIYKSWSDVMQKIS